MRMLRLLLLVLVAGCSSAHDAPWIGANVKTSPDAPWGSDAAAESLRRLAASGARVGLLVAFVWQPTPTSSAPVLGSDSGEDQVRAGLRQMRAAGLRPMLKVHLWIPGHWAGEADPGDRPAWFSAYRDALLKLARVAAQERAEALVVGTELRKLQDDPQWPALVAAVRAVYPGRLLYVADGLEHAASFRYWPLFDVVGVSLYPKLPQQPGDRLAAMHQAAAQLRQLGERVQRPVWVAELGLRSAAGSLALPWESPEQRQATVDTALQAEVLAQWRQVLSQARIGGIGIWCWYTDPDAGGASDSDFTVQNKPAQAVFGEAGRPP